MWGVVGTCREMQLDFWKHQLSYDQDIQTKHRSKEKEEYTHETCILKARYHLLWESGRDSGVCEIGRGDIVQRS